uniref:coiled-coil domain-containing protein 170-like n=1 Tax=Halichoerus grypus TaxID=9711 RepID=UPI00165A1372
SKGLHEAKSSKVKHLSVHTSQKNSPVACFDPPVVVPTKNSMMYNKRAADPVHPDLTGLLVKNKNLLAELRNLQNKLLIKETSLQEMKNELESYKENNVQQSFQIMSLKDDIKDLEELIASLTRIKSLKNTNIQNLERGNWDLTERIIELENRLRVHLFEREKAERKAGLLEKKLAGTDGFTPYMNMKENSGTKNSWTDKHGKMSRQLEKDNGKQTLLNIQQNLQIATTQRLEEKIQKLQKQLSDLKLSNKSMKIQLTRVNVLKNKTIEKLRQSLTQVEAMKGKAVMKTDNLKTTLDSAKEEARGDKEKVHQLLDTVTPEFCTAKGTLDKVPGQKHELSDFREIIMKMLGFNMRTADKEIINHLRLIIQDYEASNKSKIASDCETGQDNK